MPIDASSLPPFHTMFPPHEQRRVQAQAIRYAIAMEDVATVLDEHMQDYLSDEVRATWGEPDRARNTLAAVSHALSTPGHYGRAPTVVHPDAATAAALNTEMRPVWARQQHVEYLAYACGSVATLLTRLEGEADGEQLVQTVAPAHLCYAEAGEDPTRPVVFRWLRVQEIEDLDGVRPAYVWYVWDIRDPAAPSYRACVALADGALGADLTVGAGLPEAYPFVGQGGRPYMPWTIHRSHDVGDLWNWQRGGSAARATLNTMMLWTAATAVALRSTGKITLLIDCGPPASRTQIDHATGVAIATLDAQPGAIVQLASAEGKQGSAIEVGGVDTLASLTDYAKTYAAQTAQDMGVAPSDAARVGANPMSGAALAITNEQKRLEQQRRGELARQADIHTLRVACALLGLPPEGVGILYDEIELSTLEQKADLEADQVEIDMGIASRVDVLMRRRPGLTREQAIAELRRVQADEAAVNQPTGYP